MTKKPVHSVDGFIVRRRYDPSSGLRPSLDGTTPKPLAPDSRRTRKSLPQESLRPIEDASTVDETTIGSEIQTDIEEPKKSRRQRRKEKKLARGHSKKRRIIKWVIIALLIIVLAVGAYFGYKLFITSSKIFTGNAFTALFNQGKPLKQDSLGRSNVLILGTSEDDPGHAGGNLTDSMMVLSIDQNKKNSFMFSVPRDLYVKYGRACNSGYAGKINEYFDCVKKDDSAASEQAALKSASAFIGSIYGLDIQYAAHVNNTVIKEAVNAVGGVDVDVEGSGGAPGILDRNFDWRCGYKCFLVKYDNGVHHLDGEHALWLAMARGDIAPTYGLGNSNFDREKNQQKIIIALKEKAVSTGTLTNIGTVNSLLEALGNNIRTNFDASEVKTLVGLVKDVPSDAIKRIDFYGDEPLYKTGNIGGASVVIPASGQGEYAALQKIVYTYATNDAASLEKATIDILNATDTPGVANTKAAEIEKNNLTVEVIGNAPTKYASSGAVQLYDLSAGKMPETLKKLQNILGVKAAVTLPQGISSQSNFVIIVGNGTN